MRFKLLTLFCILTIHSFSQNIPLYVGTYTDTISKGIYSYNFNIKTGELTNLTLVAKTENPSFLTFSKDKKTIYAVNEVANYNELNSGFVSSFKVLNNGLELLNKVSSNGAHPCHVSLSEDGEKAVISNYTGGTISIHSILNNGKISEAFQIINHNNTPQKSHTHSAQFFKNELFVADLGLNTLSRYNNSTNGILYRLKNNYLIKTNAGPRHFEVSKKGQFIYVINELNSTISVLRKLKKSYSIIQNISTLDKNFKGQSFCADIHLSKNRKFLYGSNRGENSIAVFKINKKGILKKIQTISTKGNWPRNFIVSPNGKFLLVANQKSNNISVYQIHKKNGQLTFLHSVNVSTPVCLLF